MIPDILKGMILIKSELKPLPFACVQCDPGEAGYYKRKDLSENLSDGKYICLSCGETSEVKTMPQWKRQNRTGKN
jgi:hypothetical protein